MLRTKTRERLYQVHAYRAGRVDVLALRGFFHVVERVQGQNASIPDLTITTNVALNAQAAPLLILTGPGRLYFSWATSPATGSTLDAIISYTDNAIPFARYKVKSGKSAEAYFYAGDDGVGIPFTTNLKVNCLDAATGAADPAVGDRPDVTTVWGDNTVNTSDSNLINTNYG
jgi:hypothetical protein